MFLGSSYRWGEGSTRRSREIPVRNATAVLHGPFVDDRPLPAPTALYEVHVELGDTISDEELRHDLDADPFHWLLEFRPRVARSAAGRVTVTLSIPGPDLWTTALTTMAALRQSGYDLHALHVVNQDGSDERSAA